MKNKGVLVAWIILFLLVAAIVAIKICENDDTVSVIALVDSSVNTIIVDPGHGGVDGGAVGTGGEIEKDINLSVSLKLKELLEADGFEVIMTRDSDMSLHDESAETIRKQKTSDLHNRLKIIESNKNALFISVHQNSTTENKSRGAQMFYSQNNMCSELLAQSIQDSFVENIQPENKRQIKQAGENLFLLYNAKNPAVLCECGFLSNPDEAKNLASDEYQSKVANAIYEGIKKYLGR